MLGIRKLGDIFVKFGNKDLERFERKYTADGLLYKLDYSVHVVFGAEEGLLKFETRMNDRVVGDTSIEYADAFYY